MDKTTIGFFADVLYLKGILCFEEFEAIQSVKTEKDLGDVFENMMEGKFNVYKRGEQRPTGS